ncbi:MAG: hypothetical protein ACXWUN_12750 [Allosphingosinicella sp.]
MAENTTRGSDALFSFGKDEKVLVEALGAARADYTVKWWWRYGQPAIDWIRADLEIPRENFARAFTQIMEANSRELQVTAEVTPQGVEKLEGFRVQVDIRQATG